MKKLLKSTLLIILIMLPTFSFSSAKDTDKVYSSVKGRILFSNYYAMDGSQCSAIIEGEDGGMYCVLDSQEAAQLKYEAGENKKKVKVIGSVTPTRRGVLIKVEKYEILEESEKEPDEEKENESEERPYDITIPPSF